jgi:HD-like signal output (HDOD) protein
MNLPENSDQRVQAILASGIKIPPIPVILLRLNELLRDPDTDAAALAALISHDGALSGAVFRVIGSPVFGLRSKVDSLPHAISLLGLQTIGALLRSEILVASLSDPQHARALEKLWQRSAAIAELCLRTVKTARLRDINAEAAYMIGMFHDCGLALLCKRFPIYAQALSAGDGWPDIPALDQSQNLSHAVMGQMVAKNWALPEILVQAIRHHHDPIEADARTDTQRLCGVLNLAIHLYDRQQEIDDPDWAAHGRADTMQRLGADADQLDQWQADILSDAA